MANWQRKLMLADVWDGPESGRMTIQELADIVADRLSRLKPFRVDNLDEERDELVGEFYSLSDDPTATVNNFDSIMERLYNWGDTRLDDQWNGKKACWIDTISTGTRA